MEGEGDAISALLSFDIPGLTPAAAPGAAGAASNLGAAIQPIPKLPSYIVSQAPPYLQWDALIQKGLTGAELHDAIVKVLMEHCFDCTGHDVAPVLLRVLPLLDAMIHTKNLKDCRLKDSLEFAKYNGFPGIKALSREKDARIIFEAAFLVLAYMYRDVSSIKYSDVGKMLSGPYADWKGTTTADERELETCRVYANFMSIAVLLLPPKLKKAHLTDLVTRVVEGKSIKYIFGGGLVKYEAGAGKTAASRRRERIYEVEGNVSKMERVVKGGGAAAVAAAAAAAAGGGGGGGGGSSSSSSSSFSSVGGAAGSSNMVSLPPRSSSSSRYRDDDEAYEPPGKRRTFEAPIPRDQASSSASVELDNIVNDGR